MSSLNCRHNKKVIVILVGNMFIAQLAEHRRVVKVTVSLFGSVILQVILTFRTNSTDQNTFKYFIGDVFAI